MFRVRVQFGGRSNESQNRMASIKCEVCRVCVQVGGRSNQSQNRMGSIRAKCAGSVFRLVVGASRVIVF